MRILSLLIPLLLCTACDDGGTDDADAAVPSMTPAEAATAYQTFTGLLTNAQCERDARCDGDTQGVTDCVVAAGEELGPARDRIQASIAVGQTAYDDAAATACVAKYNGDCSLSLIQEILPVCNQVIEGLLAVDAECKGHFECADVPGHMGRGPYCFDGCDGLFGMQPAGQTGLCVLESPIAAGACD